MSDEAIKEKKKLTKKSKILIIVLSIVAFLLIATVLGGVIALNQYCKTKDYTVISTSDNVTLVAHRGMRSVAPENTTASFTEAGKHGYWGAECDVYRTKDGVWIISHDSHTYRMMDKSAFIEKKTYEELMDMNVDNGVNIDKYEDLKICSLEEYLDISTDGTGIPVSITIDDPSFDRDLYAVKPGFTCSIRFTADVGPLVQDSWTIIPLSAVFGESEGKKMYVWVVEDNKVHKREVTVNAPTGEAQVLISKGLKPEEKIVIAGVYQLVEGENVKDIEK